MGVQGLQTFLQKHKYCREVSIETEIEKWKRQHPDVKPIIVFDISGLRVSDDALLTGGNSSNFENALKNWLGRLKELDVKLIFFQSLSHETWKFKDWMQTKSIAFRRLAKMYDESNMENLLAKAAQETYPSLNLISITAKYGEYKFGRPGVDCDQEIAHYAMKHTAMAIFSSDTNFMIFDGYWKFWSYLNLINLFNEFKVLEFDRLAINQELLLTFEHRPLLATLLGNDFTKRYRDELCQFHCNLRCARQHMFSHAHNHELNNKFFKVSAYIRDLFQNENLNRAETAEISSIVASAVFGENVDDEKRQLIVNSIKSYDTNFVYEVAENDECKQLALSNVYLLRIYLNRSIDAIQSVEVPFIYNVHGRCSEILNDCLTKMLRKQMGLVNPSEVNRTFKLISKKTYEGDYGICDETPIFPEFQVVPMKVLLSEDSTDAVMIDERWKVLGWLLSISDLHRNKLKSTDRPRWTELRVSCAALLILVQADIISIESADGILITETTTTTATATATATAETCFNAYHMNRSHVYKSVYRSVKKAFLLAGLSNCISDSFKFNGVYYQNLMASDDMVANHLSTIEPYRIYAN